MANEQKCLDCGKFLSKAGTLVCSPCTQRRINAQRPKTTYQAFDELNAAWNTFFMAVMGALGIVALEGWIERQLRRLNA